MKEPDVSASRDDHLLLVPSLAGAVGNLLEWYDFGLYGLFAPIFAQLFFPGEDRIASLIGAYSGFAIGFAARPLGAAVLGHLGDRAGRRAIMVCSIVLMGFATTATALLPTYHAIGMGAPNSFALHAPAARILDRGRVHRLSRVPGRDRAGQATRTGRQHRQYRCYRRPAVGRRRCHGDLDGRGFARNSRAGCGAFRSCSAASSQLSATCCGIVCATPAIRRRRRRKILCRCELRSPRHQERCSARSCSLRATALSII